MSYGKSIRIFLADSSVTGIRYAELVNWTGQALACPRSRMSALNQWNDFKKPGVYFLFEARLGDEKPKAYIGESESVIDRLISHDKNKDFWNEVVIFSSKDENLTKSHIKFLESSLVALAKEADRYELDNGNTPPESSLPLADKAAMREFIDNLRMVIGTLGYPIFEPLVAKDSSGASVSDKSSAVELSFRVKDFFAKGLLTDQGFVVLKGARISAVNSESVAERIVDIKHKMQEEGSLVVDGNGLLLTEDTLFSSSSYAASFVAGTKRGGPESWMTAAGVSLKYLEGLAKE